VKEGLGSKEQKKLKLGKKWGGLLKKKGIFIGLLGLNAKQTNTGKKAADK